MSCCRRMERVISQKETQIPKTKPPSLSFSPGPEQTEGKVGRNVNFDLRLKISLISPPPWRLPAGRQGRGEGEGESIVHPHLYPPPSKGEEIRSTIFTVRACTPKCLPVGRQAFRHAGVGDVFVMQNSFDI